MAALALLVEFGAPFTCANCGTPMVVAKSLEKSRREANGEVYCPNGHVLRYGGGVTAELERTKKSLAAAEARAKVAENSCALKTRALDDLNKRVRCGVCPCCKRSFQNLRRHMATKHPEAK